MSNLRARMTSKIYACSRIWTGR